MNRSIFLIVVGICLLTSFTSTALGQQGKYITHAKAISIMKNCLAKSFDVCNEDTVNTVILRYWSGDRVLLKPLLDTHKVSDGALSEALTVFYGDLLQKRPEAFAAALLPRPKQEQRSLAHDTIVMLSEKAAKRVRGNLKRIAERRNNLSPVARLCLGQF